GTAENSYRSFTGDHESRFIYDSLSVGATPLGMRTRDVLNGVDYLRSRSGIDAKRISLIGQGSAGLPVFLVRRRLPHPDEENGSKSIPASTNCGPIPLPGPRAAHQTPLNPLETGF